MAGSLQNMLSPCPRGPDRARGSFLWTSAVRGSSTAGSDKCACSRVNSDETLVREPPAPPSLCRSRRRNHPEGLAAPAGAAPPRPPCGRRRPAAGIAPAPRPVLPGESFRCGQTAAHLRGTLTHSERGGMQASEGGFQPSGAEASSELHLTWHQGQERLPHGGPSTAQV